MYNSTKVIRKKSDNNGSYKMPFRAMKSRCVYIALGFIVLIIGILSEIVPSESLLISQNPIYALNEGWQISSEDFVYMNQSLPIDLNLELNAHYVAERALPQDFPVNAQLRIRSSMQQFVVRLDGEVLFNNYRALDSKLKSPEASVWYFINLPSDSAGKKLTLEWESSIKAFSGLINPVYYGSGDALIFDILKTYKWGIFVGLLLILTGGITTIVSYFILSLKDKRALYLGVFSMTVGIWVLSEARVIQFLTGNRFLIGGISYMMLSLFPIPFLLYIRETVLKKFHNWFYIPVVVFLSTFFINIGLQISGLCPFIESIFMTHVLMVVSLVLVMGLVIREAIVYDNLAARKFISYFSMLMVTFLFEIVQFAYHNFDAISVYSRLGLVIFFILLIRDTFKYFNQLMESEKEAKVLLKLAYIDVLTGAYNRTAFERDVKKVMLESKAFRLILFDINDLKIINDQYGHMEGDLAIKNSYHCIKTSIGNLGEVYRIGGDEFASIIRNVQSDSYDIIVEELQKQLSQLEQHNTYILDVAVGSEIYDGIRFKDFESLFVYTDKLMYQNKRTKE